MKTVLLVLIALSFVLAPAAAAPPKTKKERVSYAIGVDIGRRLKSQKLDVDPVFLARGLNQAIAGGKLELTGQEIGKTLSEFRRKMRSKIRARRSKGGAANLAAGQAFLRKNKNKPGVKTTKSGLQYKIVRAGKGKSPARGNKVTVHYRGTLIDGTEFDSSYARKKPATFPVSGVIKGWTEALLMMKPGAKWQVFVPPSLGYGQRGAGAKIGPNATLIFDVELIEVK